MLGRHLELQKEDHHRIARHEVEVEILNHLRRGSLLDTLLRDVLGSYHVPSNTDISEQERTGVAS